MNNIGRDGKIIPEATFDGMFTTNRDGVTITDTDVPMTDVPRENNHPSEFVFNNHPSQFVFTTQAEEPSSTTKK